MAQKLFCFAAVLTKILLDLELLQLNTNSFKENDKNIKRYPQFMLLSEIIVFIIELRHEFERRRSRLTIFVIQLIG
jgi:hypothetical protein